MWVISNEVLAAALAIVIHRTARRSVNIATSFFAAERRSEGDLVVGQLRIDFAGKREAGLRCAELGNVGISGSDTRWDRAAREEPELDGLRCPFHSVDSAFDVVERGPVQFVARFDSASRTSNR